MLVSLLTVINDTLMLVTHNRTNVSDTLALILMSLILVMHTRTAVSDM